MGHATMEIHSDWDLGGLFPLDKEKEPALALEMLLEL